MIPTKFTHARQLEWWMEENHPGVFNEWELEASSLMDLWDWLQQEHYGVIDEFRKAYRERLTND